MDVVISNNIKITQPNEQIKKWVKQNLMFDNPEYQKKVKLGLWRGDTPKKIMLYKVIGDTLVLPYGVLKSIFPYLLTYNFVDDTFVHERMDYGEDLGLYEYQEYAVNESIKKQGGVLISKPGSGKTQMGLGIIKQLGLRALWITHTKDLLDQSKSRAEQYFKKELIGTITEGKVNVSKGVTFSTIQTLVNVDMEDLKNYWDIVIVDECHRITKGAKTPSMFYKVVNSLNAKYKFGLTATLHRSDGLVEVITALLGKVAVNIDDDWVSDKVMQVGIDVKLTDFTINDSCLASDGTIHYAKLVNTMTRDGIRNKQIANDIIKEEGKSCLVLCQRIEHLQRIMNELPYEIEKEAVMISGKSKRNERREALEQMRSGEKRILLATYQLAKEGLDIPRLERLFLATPQKDYAVVTQSIGRIARSSRGKKDAIAYDYVDKGRFFEKRFKERQKHYKDMGCYYV